MHKVKKSMLLPILALAVIGTPLTILALQQQQDTRSQAAGDCTVTPQQLTIKVQEQELFNLINQYRAENGVGPLTWDDTFKRAAAWLTNDMVTNNHLSHFDSLGRTPNIRLPDCGVSPEFSYGENISSGPPAAPEMLNSWKSKPDDNQNILNPDFTLAAISMDVNESGTQAFWVMDFGSVQAPNPSPTIGTTPPAPTGITPTVFCLGSCPTIPPDPPPTFLSPTPFGSSPAPTTSGTSPVPTSGGTNPTTAPQPTIDPCQSGQTSTLHGGKKKKKKNRGNNGGGFFQRFFEFLFRLIEWLLERIGLTPPSGNPGSPTEPCPEPTNEPEPTDEPAPTEGEDPEPTTGTQPSPTIFNQPTTPPTSGTVPVGSTEVFVGNYDTGDFSQWTTCQWKGMNSGCDGYGGGDYMAQIVNDGPGHETAARYEVRPGDEPEFGGERSEVAGHSDGALTREGDERWYEFSLKVPEGSQPPEGANSGGHFIFMQWHSGSGSPPFHVSLDAENNLILWHRWDSQSQVIGPVDPGNWHDYVIHVMFSNSDSEGFVEVWRDGQQVIQRTAAATMSSSENYLKQGIYRGGESFTSVVFHDGLRITAP